ncbi:MAG TPA: hypothetical protein HA271_06785 [Methanobacterium subterraneum]|uniref:Uncharacterized protein n=1 Tax=Methanobacterium subterraneum TaxID=59277 RepID=A0A7J4TLX4_9EURY|nr:hypothetical protein [Methanobacterium subterraneum]
MSIINKLTRYKLFLEEERPNLVEELFQYYHREKTDEVVQEVGDFEKGNPKKVNFIRYHNPYEAYLTAQIQLDEALILILNQHISFLEDGDDVDLVLESLEHSIYRVKKQAYTNVEDWEKLLDHLTEDRMEKIKINPKGHGDLLLKELIWIRNYETRWMKNEDH